MVQVDGKLMFAIKGSYGDWRVGVNVMTMEVE